MRGDCKYTTLGEVCEVINGLWIGKKEPFINIAVIRNTNFSKDCRLNLSDVAYIDAETKQFAKRRLQYGDIIIEKSGGSEKQPVGRAVLFDVTNGDYSFSNFTATLRIKDGVKLNPHFLHRCLCAHYFRGETLKMQSKTTGLHNLDMKAYLKLQIPCLSIAEQERVVAELDLLTGIIDKQKQQIKELDILAHSVYNDMFGSVDRNTNNIEVKSLNDVFQLITDGTHQTPQYTDDVVNGYKFLSAKDVVSGTIDWTRIKYIPESLHKELHKRLAPRRGDILLCKNGTTGICALVDTDDIFDIYVSLALLRTEKEYNKKYLVYAINNPSTKSQFDDSLKGVGVPNLHLGEIKKTKILIPSIELQSIFAKKIAAIESQKESINRSIAESQKLFDYTMDKYFG